MPKLNRPHVYISDDYAGLSSKDVKFYYGYEVVSGDNEEWCFTATFQQDGKENTVTIPYSKLGTKASMYSVDECLLQGIAWIFYRYKLVPASGGAL